MLIVVLITITADSFISFIGLAIGIVMLIGYARLSARAANRTEQADPNANLRLPLLIFSIATIVASLPIFRIVGLVALTIGAIISFLTGITALFRYFLDYRRKK